MAKSAEPPNSSPPGEPPTPPEPPAAEEKYTPEWYESVEKRFQDLGDFIRSGRATHANQPEGTPPPTQTPEGQPASHGAPNGQGSIAGSAGDTRPPKPNHWWFRTFGGN